MREGGMRRRHVELAMGLGLLLGPLVYALTLEPDAPESVVIVAEPAPAIVPEPVMAEPVEVEIVEPEIAEPEIAEPEIAAPEIDRAPFLLVTDAGIVLSTEAKRGWGTGKLFEPPGQVTYRAAKRADLDQIPSALLAMRERTFDLYGPEGKVCVARLGELRVVAQYGGWSLGGVLGEDWHKVDPEGASKSKIRAGLWRRDDLWLVAEIESSDSCKGALWARDAELPAPVILRRSSAPNPRSEARVAEFSRSEKLAEIGRNYREAYAEIDEEFRQFYSSWEELVEGYGASAWSWLDPQGRPQVVELEFGLEHDGCGGEPLWSYYTALDYVRGDEFVPESHGTWPAAVFDADHDGRLELLYVVGENRRWLKSASLSGDATVEEDWICCPC